MVSLPCVPARAPSLSLSLSLSPRGEEGEALPSLVLAALRAVLVFVTRVVAPSDRPGD